MKNLIFILALLSSLISHAQTYRFYQTDNVHNQLRLNVKNGEVYQIQDDGQKFLVHGESVSDSKNDDRYELYKTKNIWTYILLDKCTGKLWQCQYSIKGVNNIVSIEINSESFSDSPASKFTIQPLVSMFQYYLINQETGDMWKFQWSTQGGDYRWITKM
jgi:hypothetical protein